MKTYLSICAALLLLVANATLAADASKTGSSTKSAATAKPAMDPKAMEEMMAKMAAPGPYHDWLKKFEGEWNLTIKWSMDPSQPMQETKSTSMVKTIMDGRYSQEETAGEMMGKPFNGMGITGYDNMLKKFVSTWIDNAGTGIMTSQGTPDATGKVINWIGQSTDPMTGKMAKYRMVSRVLDDNHHVLEMYMKSPEGKEFKSMEINYERKM